MYVITATLRRLKNLPVWVVVRLCTDDPRMVTYWNNIDSEVELNMDVIDDPLGEAKEIFRCAFFYIYSSIHPYIHIHSLIHSHSCSVLII